MAASLLGVVTFDGKRTGKLMPGEFQALLISDKVRSLPHPLERSALRAHSQTYFSARFERYPVASGTAGLSSVRFTSSTLRA